MSFAPLRRSLIVLASGALLGLVVCMLDAMWISFPAVDSVQSVTRAAQGAAASDAVRRGVFAMTAAPKRPHIAATPVAPAVSRQPQEPEFPFSFLGKVTEDGEATILLYGAGRTLKVRHAGPLDMRYVVDDILDDRLIVRDLASGTRHVVELASRQYAVPGSLRGEYPQD